LSRALDAQLTPGARRPAVRQGTPQIHHAEQGAQQAGHDDPPAWEAAQGQISLTDIGQAWHNRYAERCRGIREDEAVSLIDYADFHDAYHQIGRFVK
jgi:hypothetical protein